MLTAFSNLNRRFETLVGDPSFPLKLNYNNCRGDVVNGYCTEILFRHAHRLVQLSFAEIDGYGVFFNQFVLNESLQRLQSISFRGFHSAREVLQLLSQLKALPSLHRLKITLPLSYSSRIKTALRLMFSIRTLHTLLIDSVPYTFEDENTQGRFPTLPRVPDDQPSLIRDLSINHPLGINAFPSLLRFTPQLRRLYCDSLYQSNMLIDQKQIPSLPHLTTVCMTINRAVKLNKLESWLQTVGQPVKTLKLWIEEFYIDYLDATRWEKLIEKYMVNLREFHLTCYKFEEEENLSLLDLIKRFSAPFWLQRHSLCAIEFCSDGIDFSVCPIK